MGQLHELLAVEKTKNAASSALIKDTQNKFAKFEYFQGHIKTLKMIENSPQNDATEAAGAETKQLPTTVHETLEYMLKYWADAEDVIFQKNVTNQRAVADLMFRGSVIKKDVPVDELLGLESRLETMRHVMVGMPTLNAAVAWKDQNSGRKGAWVAVEAEKTTKTEKATTAVVLYHATEKHPAQVKEVPTDKTVGIWTLLKTCGAATSAQKAEVLAIIDDLLSEAKQARMRANSVEASTDKIGSIITNIIMSPFTNTSGQT